MIALPNLATLSAAELDALADAITLERLHRLPPVVRTGKTDEYSLDHGTVRQLRHYATTLEDRDAIFRLAEFRGTADDLRHVAAIFSRVGEHERARFVLAFDPRLGVEEGERQAVFAAAALKAAALKGGA